MASIVAATRPSSWPDVALSKVLRDAPVVVFGRDDDLEDRFARAVTRGRDAGPARHCVPSSEGFADAVAAGMGWGMVPQAQAEPLLRDGTLVNLDPGRPIDVPLHWQQWKLDSPALAATADAVVAAAARTLRAR